MYREHTDFRLPRIIALKPILNLCTPGQNTRPRRNSIKKKRKKKRDKRYTMSLQRNTSDLNAHDSVALSFVLIENVAFERKNLHRNDVRFAIVT